MCNLFVLFGLLTAHAIAFAQVYPKAWLCVAGCRRSVDYLLFDVPEELEGTCHDLYATSLFACTAQYCTQHQTEVGFPSINRTYCISQDTPLPPYDFTAAHALLADNVTWVSYPEGLDRDYAAPAVPDQEFYQLGYDTENAYNTAMMFNWALAHVYTATLAIMSNIGFWALLLLAAASLKQISLLRNSARRSPALDSSDDSKSTGVKSPRSWLERHLLVTPAWSHSGVIVPNRLEALLVLTYALLNFVSCFLGYRFMKISLLDWHAVQYERFIANRCGYLLLSNLPIVWLFATRNNPFIWLTHWSFDTFNFFHKWIARLTGLLALVHGICYTIGDSKQDNYISSFKKDLWYRCGIFGLVTMSIMIFLSSRYFRMRAYDLFLLLHTGMAVAILVLIKTHLTVWKIHIRKDFWAFIWTCIAFWVFDRVLRLARILYTMWRTGGQSIKTTATYDPDAGMIRLDVSPLFRNKSVPRPGAYYHIYEPGQWRAYENHPFSLCSWSVSPPSKNTTERTTSSAFEDEKQNPEPTIEEEASRDSLTAPQKQTFLIRPQAGWTQRLAKKLSNPTASTRQQQQQQLTLLYEGPYYTSHALTLPVHSSPSSTLLLLGGTGITAAISHLHASSLSSSSSSLRILWIARTWSFCHHILQHELAHLPRHLRLEIFLTADPHCAAIPAAAFPVFHGRPDLRRVVAEARRDAVRDLTVFCCGPAGMGREVREVVRGVLEEGVDFFYEGFSW